MSRYTYTTGTWDGQERNGQESTHDGLGCNVEADWRWTTIILTALAFEIGDEDGSVMPHDEDRRWRHDGHSTSAKLPRNEGRNESSRCVSATADETSTASTCTFVPWSVSSYIVAETRHLQSTDYIGVVTAVDVLYRSLLSRSCKS